MRRRLGIFGGKPGRESTPVPRPVQRSPRTGLATGTFVLAALVILLALGFAPTLARSDQNPPRGTTSNLTGPGALGAAAPLDRTSATPSAVVVGSSQMAGYIPNIKPTPTLTPSPVPKIISPTATPAVGHFSCPGNTLAGCPYQLTPTGNLAIDNVWYGQIPSDPSTTSKPVLLFVHGDTDVAEAWWTDVTEMSQTGVNDMYLLAYNAGYRTAFVQLQTTGGNGPDYNSFVNDQILAQQIQAVAQAYGVSQMDVVTHSKGGLDLQAAMALENDSNGRAIGSYINTVVMLSPPNQGSALANVVCTPGASNPPVYSGTMTVTPTVTPPIDAVTASCSMTPNFMTQTYRRVVDPGLVPFLAPATGTPSAFFWVSGGTDQGPAGSTLNTAGQLLSQLDPTDANDGFVPVLSATTLNNSRYLFVRAVNHDSIRIGHNSWPWIQMLLTQATPAPTSAAYTPQPTAMAPGSRANQNQPKR